METVHYRDLTPALRGVIVFTRFGHASMCRLCHYPVPMNVTLLTFAAIALYLAATGLIGVRLYRRHEEKNVSRAAVLISGFLALAVHAGVLYAELHTAQGINLSFFNVASLTAWMVSALLLASALGKPVETLGLAVFPIACLALLADLSFPGRHLLADEANWELRLHVVISILAYAMLTLATLQALILAIQDRHLRSHHPGGFIRALPPLQTMESLLFEMIGLGFVLLSLSLLSGFLYLDDMFAQHVVHKTLLSLIAWVVFALLLWGRYRFGWRGRTAIRWTLAGFVLLMLAYFGSKAILELVLQR